MNNKQIPEIYPGIKVKSYRYGDTLELTTATGLHEQKIMTLPNRKYLVIETGEIRDMDVSSTTRADNLKSVKVTMRKLRRLITHNFKGGNKELWITLTYGRLMADPETAYQDFKRFIRKIRKKFGQLEYIAVIEPQATGSFHFHILLKTVEFKVLRIPNLILAQAWGEGFTKTKRLKNKDKIGNYVLSYVTNLEIPDTNGDMEKKFVKGARLHLYPKGVRIYRCSRGIEKPIELTASKREVMKINGVIKGKADFSRKTVHAKDSGEEIIYITEFYNDIERKGWD